MELSIHSYTIIHQRSIHARNLVGWQYISGHLEHYKWHKLCEIESKFSYIKAGQRQRKLTFPLWRMHTSSSSCPELPRIMFLATWRELPTMPIAWLVNTLNPTSYIIPEETCIVCTAREELTSQTHHERSLRPTSRCQPSETRSSIGSNHLLSASVDRFHIRCVQHSYPQPHTPWHSSIDTMDVSGRGAREGFGRL